MTRYRLILIPLLLFHVVFVLAANKDDKEAPDAKGGGNTEEVPDDVLDKSAAAAKSKAKPTTESGASKDPKAKTKDTTATENATTTAKPAAAGAKTAASDEKETPEVMRGKIPTKLPKKSPWEQIPNAPTFVGHLIVPYPTSNFISLTMKQAYVLYLWLQVRRMQELFKETSEGVKPDDGLNPDDITAMISDYSKTGFLKLPLPYKPPLFLPTDTENIEGTGKERNASIGPYILAPDTLAATPKVQLGQSVETPLNSPVTSEKPPEITSGSKGPPSQHDALQQSPASSSGSQKPPPITAALEKIPPPATGSQSFPPPSTNQFPSFPAFRSQVFAKTNPKENPPHLPIKINPGVVSFPSKVKPRPQAVYPTPEREKQAPPKRIPPPLKPKVPPQRPSKTRPIRDKRRFFQRVSNYMNQLGTNRRRARRK